MTEVESRSVMAAKRRPARPVALVTGGSRGIGAAIANQLVLDGCRVGIIDRRAPEADDASSEQGEQAANLVFMKADIRETGELSEAVDVISRRLGSIDILVNNAAETPETNFWDITEDEWDNVLVTNLRSCVMLIQMVCPSMVNAGWGRVINVASIAAQRGEGVSGCHYAASKAGMIAVTKTVAVELAGFGVTVNAVAPAAIRTPVTEQMDDDKLIKMKAGIPVGRFGNATDVSELVGLLCGDGGGFITGATLDVNGGLLMR